ncbi:hypothetical protein HYDPIDRAFT_63201, partial [Hydnomerulius pinastri MD-312]
KMAEDTLSDEDLAILRAFALKVQSHMTMKTYEMLPFAFPTAPPPSWKSTQTRAATLSGVEPVLYDCCVNSCCCYVGPNADYDHCPYCNEPRLDARGKPRQQYTYVPLIPRLVGMFRNKEMAEKMTYRANHHHHTPDIFTDIFDGSVYQDLLRQKVRANNQNFSHHYFDDPCDIALGLATDGFAPFRKRKTT